GWYLLYRYWPTSHNTHKFEAYNAFHPATTVRERVEHEVASVVPKEFALQDAGMLGGTQAALEYGLDEPIVDDYPLNDQEILVRHL
ncbi:(2Fe-2S)-binding protein, partial [Mycobacterium sp. ITM-2017-0098]